MTPAEARELVAQALDSGKYEQGRGALCSGYKYCCLGVATEVYMKHHPDVVSVEEGEFKRYSIGGARQDLCLLEPIRVWLGFKSHLGSFINKDGSQMHLTSLNDQGTPFTVIAHLFRHPPEGLVDDSVPAQE